jgi:two-component system sensor histidine kinase AtoS
MHPKKKPKSIRLRTRLILYSTFLVLFLMVLIVLLVEQRQRETAQMEARKRGMAIARSLAAVSTNALLSYNYVLLEQHAEKVSREEDVVYAIIHDKENRVAAYSQHDEKQGTLLTDIVSQEALRTQDPLIQSMSYGETHVPALDISVPVYIEGSQEKWGTVRIGLSLARMLDQISRTRLNLFLLGLVGLVLGTFGSILLARRITRPISRLVETTVSAAGGNLEQTIYIHTGDEIGELGDNFNHMIHQIRLHRDELEIRLHEITALKTYNDNILASMTNGLIAVDLQEKIVTLNETAEQILGRKQGETAGSSVKEILGGQHPLYRLMLETSSLGKGIFRQDVELKKQDGPLWLTVSTSLLTDGQGEKIGVLILFEDITEIKALEEKLRQADRLAALGTLSAGLAHEIKNPLSAIKTFVQLLPVKRENPSFMDKFNITVPREIDRINRVVEDLLELTRTRKRPMVNVDVNQLVSQVIDIHSEEMAKKQIVFEEHLNGTIPPIRGDSETLYRVFSNLVINAIQAMPNGGSLAVSSAQDNSERPMVRITLSDTGIGMDGTTVENLFNPFFSTKDKGVGLGMALAHKIVEDHHGSIDVFSEQGKGTSFLIRLPVAEM